MCSGPAVPAGPAAPGGPDTGPDRWVPPPRRCARSSVAPARARCWRRWLGGGAVAFRIPGLCSELPGGWGGA
eukprot:gene14684-biopygen8121